MRLHREAALAAMALALAAGCGKQGANAPWLTMPSLAAHAAWFPIGAAAVHGARPGQSPSCDACHVDKATGQPSATFRTFTCTGCHVEIRTGVFHDQPADLATFHAAVADYAPRVASWASRVAALNGGVGPQAAEDGACRECHPTGLATDHATRFPLPHQNAAATQVAVCSDCHVDLSARSKLGCAACHPHDSAATATGHRAVPGFTAATAADPPAVIQAASALCVRCHGDGAVPVTVSGHAAATGFVLGSGVHSGVAGGGCLDCHPTARTDKPFAADFQRYTCGAACHGAVPVTAAGNHDDPVALGAFHAAANVDFAGKVTQLGFDAACLSCHPDGSGGLPANHPFPVGAAPSHPPETCSSCHLTIANRNVAANIACAPCHLALDASLPSRHATSTIPVTDYGETGPQCLYCHGDAQVNDPGSHPTGSATPFQNPTHLAAGCRQCHGIARTDKPFAANWSATTCVTCHPGGIPN